MQRKNVSRFVVGVFGYVEVEFFYLLKGRDHVWNAYRDDCDEMFRIDDLHELNYDFVEKLIYEFTTRSLNRLDGNQSVK